MFNSFNRRASSTLNTAMRLIATRATQLAAALALCLLISGTVQPSTARAARQITTLSTIQIFVSYNSSHILDPSGTLTNITGQTNDQDGHTRDLYGNELIFNTNGSISDINNTVVGYVMTEGPVDTIP
jgi:hypothetical protein